MKTADVCRKYGISSVTLYARKAKHGGMDVSQAHNLRVINLILRHHLRPAVHR